MTVKTITAIGRSKFIIETEEGTSFALGKKDVFLLGIQEGALLDAKTCEEISQILRRECLRKCGMLLQSRDYSEKALREKLSQALYPADIAEGVLKELKKAGYVNETRMAEDYIRLHVRDRSRKRIENDLLGKGLSEETISLAFAEAEADMDALEREQIQKILEKKNFDPALAGWEETMKIKAFLCRKGYSQEAVRAVLGR